MYFILYSREILDRPSVRYNLVPNQLQLLPWRHLCLSIVLRHQKCSIKGTVRRRMDYYGSGLTYLDSALNELNYQKVYPNRLSWKNPSMRVLRS
jgi:hypothetical protein